MNNYGFIFEEAIEIVPGIGPMTQLLSACQRLKAQREALKLTQKDVAKAAKINIRQYQRIESGERDLMSTSFRIGLNICNALNIDPRFFCECNIY